MKNLRWIILLAMFLLPVTARAQAFSLETMLDTNFILIGEQIHFKIKVTKNKDIRVTMPAPLKKLSKEVEVIEYQGIDSVVLGNKDIITQTYLISVYDSGVFYIDPLNVLVEFPEYADTVQTPKEMIVATFVPVDMEKGIYDIKAQYDAPVTFKEILPWGAGGLLLALIIVFTVLYLKRLKQNKPLLNFSKPLEPPHVIALRDLDHLKSEKLWQQGLYKQYYSRLTDILRIYLEGRFSIMAMEMVSEEIVFKMKQSKLINDQLIEDLKSLFETSDLAKFAKATPLPDENQSNLEFVYKLVDSTKIAPSELTDKERYEDVESKMERKS